MGIVTTDKGLVGVREVLAHICTMCVEDCKSKRFLISEYCNKYVPSDSWVYLFKPKQVFNHVTIPGTTITIDSVLFNGEGKTLFLTRVDFPSLLGTLNSHLQKAKLVKRGFYNSFLYYDRNTVVVMRTRKDLVGNHELVGQIKSHVVHAIDRPKFSVFTCTEDGLVIEEKHTPESLSQLCKQQPNSDMSKVLSVYGFI